MEDSGPGVAYIYRTGQLILVAKGSVQGLVHKWAGTGSVMVSNVLIGADTRNWVLSHELGK